MKNKFHDPHHQSSSLSSKDTELRIKMYRQAWLEGKSENQTQNNLPKK